MCQILATYLKYRFSKILKKFSDFLPIEPLVHFMMVGTLTTVHDLIDIWSPRKVKQASKRKYNGDFENVSILGQKILEEQNV